MIAKKTLLAAALIPASLIADAASGGRVRDAGSQCSGLPDHAALRTALASARGSSNGGFDLDMWGTVVDRDGVVCAVAYTGPDGRGDQWPGSRVISAQKAYTANAFSLPKLALATANLYSAVQPGGSLFGLQHSNPVDTATAYKGPAASFGQKNDPLVGARVGGINVFGGGLALYNQGGQLIGAIGVSGDTSCADHAIAWRTRNTLQLDFVPGGVGPGGVDQIAYSGAWGQPHCKDATVEDDVVKSLPATRSSPLCERPRVSRLAARTSGRGRVGSANSQYPAAPEADLSNLRRASARCLQASSNPARDLHPSMRLAVTVHVTGEWNSRPIMPRA